MTNNETSATLDRIAEGFAKWTQVPILHQPDEAGPDYEEFFFPSEDGTPLEAWLIRCAGSNKRIVANHPPGDGAASNPSSEECMDSEVLNRCRSISETSIRRSFLRRTIELSNGRNLSDRYADLMKSTVRLSRGLRPTPDRR